MSRIAWSHLMRLGLVQMRLSPGAFWDLTPAELMLMSGAGDEHNAMGRAALEALAAQFPDSGRTKATESD